MLNPGVLFLFPLSRGLFKEVCLFLFFVKLWLDGSWRETKARRWREKEAEGMSRMQVVQRGQMAAAAALCLGD